MLLENIEQLKLQFRISKELEYCNTLFRLMGEGCQWKLIPLLTPFIPIIKGTDFDYWKFNKYPVEFYRARRDLIKYLLTLNDTQQILNIYPYLNPAIKFLIFHNNIPKYDKPYMGDIRRVIGFYLLENYCDKNSRLYNLIDNDITWEHTNIVNKRHKKLTDFGTIWLEEIKDSNEKQHI